MMSCSRSFLRSQRAVIKISRLSTRQPKKQACIHSGFNCRQIARTIQARRPWTSKLKDIASTTRDRPCFQLWTSLKKIYLLTTRAGP